MAQEGDLGIKAGLKNIGEGIVNALEKDKAEIAQKLIDQLESGNDPEKVLVGATKEVKNMVASHFLSRANDLVQRINTGEDEDAVLLGQLPMLVGMVKIMRESRASSGEAKPTATSAGTFSYDTGVDLLNTKPIRLDKGNNKTEESPLYQSYLTEINKVIDMYKRGEQIDQFAFTELLLKAQADLGKGLLAFLLRSLGVGVVDKK